MTGATGSGDGGDLSDLARSILGMIAAQEGQEEGQEEQELHVRPGTPGQVTDCNGEMRGCGVLSQVPRTVTREKVRGILTCRA